MEVEWHVKNMGMGRGTESVCFVSESEIDG